MSRKFIQKGAPYFFEILFQFFEDFQLLFQIFSKEEFFINFKQTFENLKKKISNFANYCQLSRNYWNAWKISH